MLKSAVEHHGCRSLAGAAVAHGFLQFVEVAVAREGPLVEFLKPFGVFLEAEAHHLTIHPRADEVPCR